MMSCWAIMLSVSLSSRREYDWFLLSDKTVLPICHFDARCKYSSACPDKWERSETWLSSLRISVSWFVSSRTVTFSIVKVCEWHSCFVRDDFGGRMCVNVRSLLCAIWFHAFAWRLGVSGVWSYECHRLSTVASSRVYNVYVTLIMLKYTCVWNSERRKMKHINSIRMGIILTVICCASIC